MFAPPHMRWSRRHIWGLIPLLYCLTASVLACDAGRIDETVEVQRVFDGDTILTTHHQKIRFIGLNTPELGHNGKPHQPFALQARGELQRLLQQHNNRIHLRYDHERKDKYHRDLAHPYLEDGTSLSRWLLERGLATTLIIPPNTWNADCYRQAEQQARTSRRGIWSLPAYQPLDSRKVRSSDRGFRLVRGKVTRIGQGKTSTWINLEGPMALRIEHRDLPYFDEQLLKTLKGSVVTAQGWLYTRKGESRIHIRHPAALRVE